LSFFLDLGKRKNIAIFTLPNVEFHLATLARNKNIPMSLVPQGGCEELLGFRTWLSVSEKG
jgi:hypothetical protein